MSIQEAIQERLDYNRARAKKIRDRMTDLQSKVSEGARRLGELERERAALVDILGKLVDDDATEA